jgi:tRNA pseudouridine38-40 synthase
MHEALQCLVGTHDFKAFTAGEEPGECTVRQVEQAECIRQGDLVRIDVKANAFLRHMMRRIVGTVLGIGEKRKSIDHMADVLRTGSKALAGPTVPAKGLCLIRVTYPDSLALSKLEEDQDA